MTQTTSGHGFPSKVTIAVGLWLVASSVALLLGLIASLSNWGTPVVPGVYYLIVTILAAGVGALITTIQGYLLHACDKQDFKLAFAPWYVGRPIMGMLLAVVFYCLIETPFLNLGAGAGAPSWTEWQLAGIGGLVGLFSKPAIEKLKEIFETVFSTRDGSKE